MWQTYLTVALVSYLLGSIPFGYILVKLFLKQDIRQTGSGNIGATNVARSGKKGLAIATLLLDAAKGAGAVALTYWLHLWALAHDPIWTVFLVSLSAAFAIIGHMFPMWLKFKGGKGVATAIGAFLMVAPGASKIALIVFIVVFLMTRYVSLSSILAAVSFPIAAYLLPLVVLHQDVRSPQLIMVLSTCSVLVILKHHANIRRLLNGTEPKFSSKKSALPSDPIQVEKNA